jgi:hypothetical protein
MDRSRTAHAALITGFAVACLGLALAFPKTPVLGRALEAGDRPAMTIDINVPGNEIQDGQFCQAYALVYNGTPPYTFTWDGQFTNADASAGPLGFGQIVSGNVVAGVYNLDLLVEDSSTPSQRRSRSVTLDIHSSHDYNPACEA